MTLKVFLFFEKTLKYDDMCPNNEILGLNIRKLSNLQKNRENPNKFYKNKGFYKW